jgi:organic hydroperoxide reductase OsmC/OhrA
VQKEFVFANSVEWTDQRKARLSADNKPDIQIASPPEFEGHPGYWTPEDMFLASINSCILTTFLYFINKFSASFLSYKSSVTGKVNMQAGGLAFTLVTIKPYVTVNSESQKNKIEKVLKTSKKHCLVSASVATQIEMDSTIVVTENE